MKLGGGVPAYPTVVFGGGLYFSRSAMLPEFSFLAFKDESTNSAQKRRYLIILAIDCSKRKVIDQNPIV